MRYYTVFITLFFSCFGLKGQNYVDVAKFSYTSVPSSGFEGVTSGENSIAQTTLLTSVPIKISDSLALLTGIDYENHYLKLQPFQDTVSMNIVTLKLGVNIKHNKKLSGTYMLLPKIASDFGGFSNAFQIGGLALLKYQLNDQTKLVFGEYINKELFGILNVPILGVYHKSKNEKLEVDIKFPIVGFSDYKVQKNLRLGADFLMIVRTFDLTKNGLDPFYVHMASNEVAGYFQLDLLKESLIIKGKAVYAMFDYGKYGDNDQTPFGMLGWYPGDERSRINPLFNSALGFKIQAIYRFQL